MIRTVTGIPPTVYLLAALVSLLFAVRDAQSLRGFWFVAMAAALLFQWEKERQR